MMHRNRSVEVHQFSMVPRADIPRSSFRIENTHKTTFDAGYLVPIYCEEVLPGDSFNLKATIFARLATPIVPVMDNLYLETFFFFVPNRLVWSNWRKFMGERANPTDSIDYQVPEAVSPTGGFAAGSVADYFGLPTSGQVDAAAVLSVNALPARAYRLIWNEWFRDQNLQTSQSVPVSDGPDSSTLLNNPPLRRGKRHDYFTSCLPWVQKGDSVTLPLGSSAPVYTQATNHGVASPQLHWAIAASGLGVTTAGVIGANTSGQTLTSPQSFTGTGIYPDNLYADLSEATAATINQIRQAFQIQKLLERDARGGTRYTELVRSHFGVVSPDARLQRPEYLGGGSTPINIHPIAQTSGTSVTGSDTPLGNLSAYGTALANGHGFSQSFTEHGFVIGLMSVRADLTYQQGLNRMWSRSTRYDYYWPVFSQLGEQAVLNKEIYCKGTATDENVFGYQERWAEYRYKPSQITGQLRSTFATPLDVWHLAQKFTALPTLNSTFIEENPPISRIIATTEQTGQQFVADMLFVNKAARPLPMYSVPGLVDHF